MSLLGNREKQLLLELARRAVTAAVERREFLETLPEEAKLSRSGGAFVTLHHRGRLRGCIGQIVSTGSLPRIVAYSAKAAALEDPRFPPVRTDELAELEIELSVLSLLEEIAPERVEAGKHGLIVSRGGQRGVLLPQVATQFRWTAERFLEETCVKAGFERDAWRESGTQIYAFTAEVFSESEFCPDRYARFASQGRVKRGYSSST
ncbi:MAG TPA: AmmeMemoRadiSam system protein A [Candidatus Polarisedimenticolia bacterium]|nr:AmmeMemoRadiSam system protein A [Candidatus Polarisedimenticolia bacterium]